MEIRDAVPIDVSYREHDRVKARIFGGLRLSSKPALAIAQVNLHSVKTKRPEYGVQVSIQVQIRQRDALRPCAVGDKGLGKPALLVIHQNGEITKSICWCEQNVGPTIIVKVAGRNPGIPESRWIRNDVHRRLECPVPISQR